MRTFWLVLLVGCGTPQISMDAGADALADAAVDAAPPCSPQCPSGQTCVNGACFVPVLQRLALSLSDPQSLSVGQMLPFRVSAVYSNGEMRDVSIEAVPSLSEQMSVRIGPIINNQPSLLGVGIGEAMLTVRYSGAQAMTRVVVASDPRLTGVQIMPSSVMMNAGTQAEIRLIGSYVDGPMMPVPGTVMWTSSDSNILEVLGNASTATLRASARGTARVTGVVGRFSANATVTIR